MCWIYRGDFWAVRGAAFKCEVLASCDALGDARISVCAGNGCLFYSREMVVVFKLLSGQVPYQPSGEVTAQTFTAKTT